MGKILIPGGGGGADLDVITATAVDVRKNKVIVDREGEPLAGTMKEMAGGTYTPGTADVVLVPANTFVTTPIIMKGDRNLASGNIKKNVTIFNIIGSFEGYVPGAADLYYNGNNVAGFVCSDMAFQALQIDIGGGGYNKTLRTSKNVNIAARSKINLDVRNCECGNGSKAGILYCRVGGKSMGSYNFANGTGTRTISIPINPSVILSGIVELEFNAGVAAGGFGGAMRGTISRIWLS